MFPAPGQVVDVASWSWVAMDKKQEEWFTRDMADDDNAKDPSQKQKVSTELGLAVWRIKPVAAPMAQNPNNPGIRMADDYKLSVTFSSGDPITKDLPPFYLPRAIDQLLPRLLPRGEPKGYMFASYVGQQKEIIRRYVDVGHEGQFMLAGKAIHAVPVMERIGLEGPVTTHYVSPEGEYLGSVDPKVQITLLPSDAPTLIKMWKDANLSRPSDVEVPAINPARLRSAEMERCPTHWSGSTICLPPYVGGREPFANLASLRWCCFRCGWACGGGAGRSGNTFDCSSRSIDK